MKFILLWILEKTTIMESSQILQANILEIIFEGKNKAYGAYYLRKTYNKRITTALIVMISLLFFTIIISMIAGRYKSEVESLPVYVRRQICKKLKQKRSKFYLLLKWPFNMLPPLNSHLR